MEVPARNILRARLGGPFVDGMGVGSLHDGFCRDGEQEAWLAELLPEPPKDIALYHRALTHGSTGQADYQRLEFLGDRILGLVIADSRLLILPLASNRFSMKTVAWSLSSTEKSTISKP